MPTRATQTRAIALLLMAVTTLGGPACSSEVATPAPTPCPTPWTRPSATALARVAAELSSLEPRAVDACVAGFMGGALVARFEGGGESPPTLPGTELSAEQAATLVNGLRSVLPAHVGAGAWSPVASGRQTRGDNVEQRVLFAGPGRTYLYVFDWAG